MTDHVFDVAAAIFPAKMSPIDATVMAIAATMCCFWPIYRGGAVDVLANYPVSKTSFSMMIDATIPASIFGVWP